MDITIRNDYYVSKSIKNVKTFDINIDELTEYMNENLPKVSKIDEEHIEICLSNFIEDNELYDFFQNGDSEEDVAEYVDSLEIVNLDELLKHFSYLVGKNNELI